MPNIPWLSLFLSFCLWSISVLQNIFQQLLYAFPFSNVLIYAVLYFQTIWVACIQVIFCNQGFLYQNKKVCHNIYHMLHISAIFHWKKSLYQLVQTPLQPTWRKKIHRFIGINIILIIYLINIKIIPNWLYSIKILVW